MVFSMVDTGSLYQFVVDSNSKWAFFKVVSGVSICLQDIIVNVAINGGLNTASTFTVTMTGSTSGCYVNDEKMTRK
ncbi:MAG TPA: hypothetical protein VE338_12205 [Ktedonobacterales bacterium]|nr:hypothetical protein [Ktedonobacterales bacterium]